jgi:transposase
LQILTRASASACSFKTKRGSGKKAASVTSGLPRASVHPGLADKRFTFAYIFAAAEPGTDNAFALVLPELSTEMMRIYLEEFAKTIAPDEHVAMVMDRAGWHVAKGLKVPDNITLVRLPPYSPELNPIESIWLYLKERYLSHRLLDDYEAVVDAISDVWNRLMAETGRVKSLCTHPWIEEVII